MKNSQDKNSNNQFYFQPVGFVRRENDRVLIKILPENIPALKGLEGFSHVQVFWWFDHFDDEESRRTKQFDKMPFDAPSLGVFACRAPMRPNPIGLTTAKIIQIDQEKGVVEIANIDAFDGTPVLDLKAYLPSCDRVKNFRVPEWAAQWPEWLPEDGLALED